MTTGQLAPISVGSCPTCGGPAQFIDDCGKGGDCDCPSVVREVRLPNIDEDLGGGWMLTGLDRLGRRGAWRATALRNGPYPGLAKPVPLGGPDNRQTSYGDSPAAAYLALRSAIEART
jgi:hypothetical protein